MTKECITLKDYLGLITDEDVRIELEIDTEEKEYYVPKEGINDGLDY